MYMYVYNMRHVDRHREIPQNAHMQREAQGTRETRSFSYHLQLLSFLYNDNLILYIYVHQPSRSESKKYNN